MAEDEHDSALLAAVNDATEWAVVGGPGRANALGELARQLARDITDPPVADGKSAPPTAAMAKELRATLEDLEGLRDTSTAEESLGKLLSIPDLADQVPAKVRNTKKSGSANAGSEVVEDQSGARKASDAVATPRQRRGDGGRARSVG